MSGLTNPSGLGVTPKVKEQTLLYLEILRVRTLGQCNMREWREQQPQILLSVFFVLRGGEGWWVFCGLFLFLFVCGGVVVVWRLFCFVFPLHYWKEGKRTRFFFLAAVFCPLQVVCCSLLLYLSKLTILVFSFPFYQAGGFIDMFGMMNDMIGNMVRALHKPVCREGEVLVPPVLLCCFSTGCEPCFMTRIQWQRAVLECREERWVRKKCGGRLVW